MYGELHARRPSLKVADRPHPGVFATQPDGGMWAQQPHGAAAPPAAGALWAPTIAESIACGHRTIASKGAIAEGTSGGGPATTTSINEPPASPPTCPHFQLTPRGTDVLQADNADFDLRIEILRGLVPASPHETTARSPAELASELLTGFVRNAGAPRPDLGNEPALLPDTRTRRKRNKKVARRAADTAPADGADAAAADAVGPLEPRAPDAAAEGRQLFIFNLPFEADEAVIAELFSSHRCTGPPVLQFNNKLRHGERKFSGRALLDMESPEEATAAIATVHGASVGDRPVSVCLARTKPERSVSRKQRPPRARNGAGAEPAARSSGDGGSEAGGRMRKPKQHRAGRKSADGIVDLLHSHVSMVSPDPSPGARQRRLGKGIRLPQGEDSALGRALKELTVCGGDGGATAAPSPQQAWQQVW